MRDPRTEARRGTSERRRLALVVSLVVAAGCAHAPRPRAEVPSDTTRATTRGNTAAKRAGAGAVQAGGRNAGAAVAPGVSSGSSTSQPAVVPQLSAAEQERLERETKVAMETAQKALDAIDVAKLDAEKNRKYVIAKDFLAQAAEARTRQEFERAQGLATKARLLAEEIAAH